MQPDMCDLIISSKNSNIVQFLAMLRKDDNTRQLVYYQVSVLLILS